MWDHRVDGCCRHMGVSYCRDRRKVLGKEIRVGEITVCFLNSI